MQVRVSPVETVCVDVTDGVRVCVRAWECVLDPDDEAVGRALVGGARVRLGVTLAVCDSVALLLTEPELDWDADALSLELPLGVAAPEEDCDVDLDLEREGVSVPDRDLVRDCVPVSLGDRERDDVGEAVATCENETLAVDDALGDADAESDWLPLPLREGDRVAVAVSDALVDLLGEREGVAAPLAVLEEDCVRVCVGEALGGCVGEALGGCVGVEVWGCVGVRVGVAESVEEADALRVRVVDGVMVRVNDPVVDGVPASDAVCEGVTDLQPLCAWLGVNEAVALNDVDGDAEPA